jgi:LmbE family N-acetylglucosaminyl deacetylase
LLVVVAHPDDEMFGCGSLLLAAHAAGWRTSVACATRGEAGEATDDTDRTRPLGEVREDELRAAARLMGATDVRLLGFVDSGMEAEPLGGSLVRADVGDVPQAVRAVVDDLEPDVIVTLDGSDGHRDHIAIRDATIYVARELGVPVFLHCLPRSLMDRWVAHMAEVRPDLAHLRGADLGTPDNEVTLTIDTEQHHEARERAMAVHASQTSPYEGLPTGLRRAFLTREHLVQVS